MNALRQFVKPHNGMIQIPVPEDMKNATRFEVFIVPDEVENNLPIKNNKKVDFKSLAGKFKHISDEKLEALDNMRNEWERDI